MNKVFLLFIAQVMIVFSVFGQITFQERISGDETEFGESVKQTSDNGYVIAGWTSSFGAGNYTYDALLIKFSSLGVIEWAKMYGGADQERIFSVQQVSDGGYILAGITKSFGPDDSEDFLLIRTNSVGDTIWTKIYGDLSINKEDLAYSVIETTTNDFVVVGCSSDWEAFVIKVNSSGNLLWSKKYGYGNYSTDEAFDIKETNDGGYIIAGRATDSEDGYYFDAFLLKTDINGNVEWFKTYGEIIEDDAARSVIQTSDNGYILVGETQSYNTNMDILVIKTDSFGTPIWAKTYGGAASDYGYSIKENGSGGYFIGGYTYSFSGDEAYIININSTGNTIWSKIYGLSGAAYIYDIQTTFDGVIVFTGDYGSDIYFGKLDGVGNSGCNQNDVITDV
ncbi:MAG: hypothetical protein C0596_18980 [Marinilabiliales bacterium]|nr:MAG: hypothetical protein C0596_18980 [Marinilabiliales bacterium]